jgi:short-subunit dehydrogenase
MCCPLCGKASVAGVVGLKRCAAYGATKFGVEGLSLSVAMEVEQFGIKITVVPLVRFPTACLCLASMLVVPT